MNPQARGLGRGLGALIPAAAPATTPAAGAVNELPLTSITPNPRQPRTRMVQAALEELAASIRQHGLIQPLVVTRLPDDGEPRYQLIAGERRWRAAQLAGLEKVPAVVREASNQQILELALVENIQRADLNPLEEAGAYQALMEEFELSQSAVAERVGKSRVAVANTLRLLKLPEAVKTMLAEGALSEGHARALLGLEEGEQIVEIARLVIARELSVRQTEELVRRLTADEETAEEPGPDPNRVQTRRLEDAFRDALGTRVSLSRGPRGGKLTVHFYSEEELNSLYEFIVGRE